MTHIVTQALGEHKVTVWQGWVITALRVLVSWAQSVKEQLKRGPQQPKRGLGPPFSTATSPRSPDLWQGPLTHVEERPRSAQHWCSTVGENCRLGGLKEPEAKVGSGGPRL